MKTSIISLIMACLCINTCLSFMPKDDDMSFLVETHGEDTYFDGSVVNDGELYALVWTREGNSFSGFKSSGELVDTNSSRLVVCLSAKHGRLMPTLVNLGKGVHDANGTYSIHLLDTRVLNVHSGMYEFDGSQEIVNHVRAYSNITTNWHAQKFARMQNSDVVVNGARDMLPAIGYVEPELMIAKEDGETKNIIVEENPRVETSKETEEAIVNKEGVVQNQSPTPKKVVVPSSYTKNATKVRNKKFQVKHAMEASTLVFLKNSTITKNRNGQKWIIKSRVYMIVPNSLLSKVNKYKSKFTQKSVIYAIYVVYSTYAIGYSVDSKYAMTEIGRINFSKKKRSKAIKKLKKL